MTAVCRCLACITPPHLLKKLLESKDADIREAALSTMLTSSRLGGERAVRSLAGAVSTPSQGRRTVYDLRGGTDLSTANLIRSEGGPEATDASVNRAYDHLGTTRDFFQDVFDRDSVDGRGMRLDAFVHYSTRYNNAMWDGQRMLFGDGDGVLFTDFTNSLDIVAHELAHGVTEFTANLTYHNQPGALNESLSDVFGSLVKQWALGQSADEADWLIGADAFTPAIAMDALRSLKAPGTAYQSDIAGTDPQPDHMDRFVTLPDTYGGDWGGVHYNSGIPNKAFYLAATGIGGNAWDAAGHIWYESLLASTEYTQFQEFADTTYAKAGQLYGTGGDEQQTVAEAWRDVGIRITGAPAAARGRGPSRGVPNTNSGRGGRGPVSTPTGGDTLAALTKQIADLATQVKALAKDVKILKDKK